MTQDHLEVSVTLENKFNDFMQELQQDLHDFLGPDVAFAVQLNFELGTEKQHEDKLHKYRERLDYLISHSPKDFQPKTKDK